jgi:hypothetical protein
MQNTPSVQNTPGKMRNKHAGSKHARWRKTRPEKMQTAPSVQNTPGKMRNKHAGAKHPAGAKHTCWCKTRPEEGVKQTVDVEYLDNIYLL